MAVVMRIESLHWRSIATSLGSAKIMNMLPGASATESFQDLALPMLRALYNHACWLTRDPIEAEDLVQETLMKALRAFGTFETGSSFKAWIYRILRNTFLTSRTALGNARTVLLDDDSEAAEVIDPAPTPEAEIIRLDRSDFVRIALEELAPQLREVILLCDLEELKYREIAVILDVPIGTVMSRLARARQALRRSLTATLGGGS
jgi:RNA polymerase sigma-70 factor (ECF subfamily)